MFETFEEFLKFCEDQDQKKKALEIRKDADEICTMILHEATPDVDIQIAMDKLKEKTRQYFPDQMELYHMIYESRFRRLCEQFRS